MIKITIKSIVGRNLYGQKCDSQLPKLTKKILDWLFLTMWTTKFQFNYKKVKSISIEAQFSYDSRGIEFSIRLNDSKSLDKYYIKQYYTNTPLWNQEPPTGSEFEQQEYNLSLRGVREERWEWMRYFILNGVDMGQEGEECMRRFEDDVNSNKNKKQEEKDRKLTEEEYSKYYLELTEEPEEITMTKVVFLKKKHKQALVNARRIRRLQKIGKAPNSNFQLWEQIARDYTNEIKQCQGES